MAERYGNASRGTKRSLLSEALHSHETTQCLTKAANPSTSAALSGRETPLAGEGQEAPHDLSKEADEEDEETLLRLGDELVSLKQADVVEQHGEQRVSDPSLAYAVPGQRPTTPAISAGSRHNFSLPFKNMHRGAETLAMAMAILARETPHVPNSVLS